MDREIEATVVDVIAEGSGTEPVVDQTNNSDDLSETEAKFLGWWFSIEQAIYDNYNPERLCEFFEAAIDSRFLNAEITVYADENDQYGHTLQTEFDENDAVEDEETEAKTDDTNEFMSINDAFAELCEILGGWFIKEYSPEELQFFVDTAEASGRVYGFIGVFVDEADKDGNILEAEYIHQELDDECIDDIESEAELGDLDEE